MDRIETVKIVAPMFGDMSNNTCPKIGPIPVDTGPKTGLIITGLICPLRNVQIGDEIGPASPLKWTDQGRGASGAVLSYDLYRGTWPDGFLH